MKRCKPAEICQVLAPLAHDINELFYWKVQSCFTSCSRYAVFILVLQPCVKQDMTAHRFATSYSGSYFSGSSVFMGSCLTISIHFLRNSSAMATIKCLLGQLLLFVFERSNFRHSFDYHILFELCFAEGIIFIIFYSFPLRFVCF